MEVMYKQIMQLFGYYLLPLFRVAAVCMIAPGLGSRMVPMRIRLAMAVIITVPIALVLPKTYQFTQFSADLLLLLVGNQIIIGLAIGFMFQLILQMIVLGAQIIAMQAGLGFAAMVDPQSGFSVPVLSQFYLMLATLLFLSLDGHLLILQALVESFKTIPIGMTGLGRSGLWEIATFAKHMFAIAVQMSLPAVVSLLLVNIALGVMTRAAPQLNIFAVGFPVTLTFGVLIVLLTLSGLVPHLQAMIDEVTSGLSAILTGD